VVLRNSEADAVVVVVVVVMAASEFREVGAIDGHDVLICFLVSWGCRLSILRRRLVFQLVASLFVGTVFREEREGREVF